ncbi:S-adenosyl-L-methionine-dependent methyltransferase [Pyrrhoderma noxium]|uniref:S-adenosyl-L-methionine-dependent methyltransferase n=1 Tax=Pyrrhoderma noxium TaxID=2282107 RepID=A0A286UQ02_9AGAM|nr:S-adenosyl-L-methionine-dependent methyltransferase [Pyrrhoderma noxium]
MSARQVEKGFLLLMNRLTRQSSLRKPPPTTLTTAAFRATLPAALGVVEAANVAEIIRPAGKHGMHVNDIADNCIDPVDPRKLARILRFLATNHWFKEVEPDVFSHNLLSSLLDTKKDPHGPLFKQTKHKDSSGLAAIIGFGGDEVIKSLSCLKDTMFDPATSFSEEVQQSAYQRAVGTKLDKWAYYDSGGDLATYRRDRFAAAMSGANKLHPPQAVVTGFDWGKISYNGLIVDVGGGKGHVSLEIAKAYPGLNFVIEDRPLVVEDAESYWQTHLPSFVKDGKVKFIGVNFFEPQPRLHQAPDVFLLRQITHDWSDKYCIKILRNLRDIASPTTMLVVIDSIMKYACNTSVKEKFVLDVKPPPPLLPNMGGANILSYTVDNLIMSTINAGERTLGGFISIFEASGWELVEIRKNTGSKIWWPSLICVPV